MSKLSTLSTRGRLLGAAAALLLTTVASAVAPTLVSADQITTRSLQLSSSAPGVPSSAPAGSASNGEKVSYTFTFTPRTGSAAIQSMSFMFCESAFGYLSPGTDTARPLNSACAVPAGFSSAQAPVPTVTGVSGSATWTVDNSGMAANVLRITSDTAVTPSGPVTVAFLADDSNYITNPTRTDYTTTPGTPPVLGFENTFFANVATYTDAAWATRYDEGTVASAITDNVNITAKVQETLRFSVGTDTPGVQTNCEALTSTGGATLTLGDSNGALSPTTSYEGNSYFRLSTNSAYGTAVQYGGDTLRSGGLLSIDPVDATGEVSTVGTEQFGLAIDQSASSLTGGTGLGGAITPAYADGQGGINAATIAFDVSSNTAPIALVDSTTFTSCDTAAIRYIANIDNNTEAGIYRTSINYIAVPKY